MITEQELNDVGAGQYLELVMLIKKLLISHDKQYGSHVTPTEKKDVNGNDAVEIKHKDGPPVDSGLIFIPDSELDQILGLKLEESLFLLVKDKILKRVLCSDGVFRNSEWASAGYRKYSGFSHVVCLRPSVGEQELNQYIADLYALGENWAQLDREYTEFVERSLQENQIVGKDKKRLALISEEELNSVGKDQYLAFLRLLKEFKGYEKSLGETPNAVSITGSLVNTKCGPKRDEIINLLVKDGVLKEFINPEPKNENMPEIVQYYCRENYYSHINGDMPAEKRVPRDQYYDIVVECLLSADALEQYIKEVRTFGNSERESPTLTAEKSVDKTESKKVSIVIDAEKGIYRKDNRKKLYPIYGARKEYVIAIYKNNGSTMQELQKIGNQSQSVISRGITEINSSVAEKLGVRGDLIMKNKTAGKYMLNKENFSFTDSRHVE